MKYRWMLGCVAMLGGCAVAAEPDALETTARGAEALTARDFDVDFVNCTEFAGIAEVPAANARAAVPAQYTILTDAVGAWLVVRLAECADVVVDGQHQGPTRTSQVGVSLLGPDGTASINNYTLAFSTTSARLKAKLTAAGAKASLAKTLDYGLSSSGAFHAASSAAQLPAFEVNGTATPPVAPPGEFIASWWAIGPHGSIRSRTVLPNIRFGEAHTTLTTPAGSELAAVIGGTTLTFGVLDSYNTFPAAHLEVRDQD